MISAYLITLNEIDTIERAVRSVSWMDEVVVLDSGSTDGTQDAARALGAKVAVAPFHDFVSQKNDALKRCTGDWVFNLDADEEVTPELRRSIEAAVANIEGWAGYRVTRRTWYFDRWIRHCGWYPEYRVRLTRSGSAQWEGTVLHESLAVNGRVGTIKGDLLHRPYDDLADHTARILRYADLWAEREFTAGRKAALSDLLVRPAARFVRMYLLRRGFIDGTAGLLASLMGAHYVFMKYARLLERSRKGP